MTRLSSRTTAAEVETLATLTQADLDRLAQLTADLSGDPARTARQLSALRIKIDGYIARIDALIAATSSDQIGALRELKAASDTTQQAAAAASAALFQVEPLPQIGSDAWKSLWESARAFSVQDAYRERPFPVTDDGSVCVLCQQDLSPTAADRLRRFDAFVRDDSQQRADTARTNYDDGLASFRRAAITLADGLIIVASVRDELGQAAAAETLRSLFIAALWRHRRIDREHRDLGAQVEGIALTFDREAIVAATADLEARSSGLLAEADSPARRALIAEKNELVDRQWLSGIQADVLAEIGRLTEISALEEAQKSTGTTRITSKSTEIAQAMVTDALRAQFALEVASFGIAGLAVELKQQSSAQGIPRFKVCLTRKPTATVGQVLSEGEHRCVALAAFMAELATAGNSSCIVFDDPVSSLDHMHRIAVAQRLVTEATARQVVVFTHDLAFLFELTRASEGADPRPHVGVSSISRGADKAGFCRNDPPFKARRVSDITASLTNQLANERRHFEQGEEDEWRKTVKSIAASLRDTWEIAVEESVGHVVRRLSNEIKTPGLIKLTVITAADCEIMRDAFGRCSEMLHSAAVALNRPLPRPEALTSEIDALAAWTTDLRGRQDRARLN